MTLLQPCIWGEGCQHFVIHGAKGSREVNTKLSSTATTKISNSSSSTKPICLRIVANWSILASARSQESGSGKELIYPTFRHSSKDGNGIHWLAWGLVYILGFQPPYWVCPWPPKNPQSFFCHFLCFCFSHPTLNPVLPRGFQNSRKLLASNSKSESNFSDARNTLTKKRSGLKPTIVNDLLFVRSNQDLV